MKKFIHLNETELRGLIQRIVEKIEDEKPHGGKKTSFQIRKKDFEDFNEILDIIEQLGGKCEEQGDGVYLVKCKRGETTDIRLIIKSLSKDHQLDVDDNFWGRRTCNKTDFPDDWSENLDWQYNIKSQGMLDAHDLRAAEVAKEMSDEELEQISKSKKRKKKQNAEFRAKQKKKQKKTKTK